MTPTPHPHGATHDLACERDAYARAWIDGSVAGFKQCAETHGRVYSEGYAAGRHEWSAVAEQDGYAAGRRRGALIGLLVAVGLALVARWLGGRRA